MPDSNVAIVEWVVQFKISSPEKFLVNVRDGLRTPWSELVVEEKV